jgi:preprotein translocase subunit SecG
MTLISFVSIEIIRKIWFFLSIVLIFSILIRKADDKSINGLTLPFIGSSKKSQKIFDRFIWILIIIYLLLGIIFQTKF